MLTEAKTRTHPEKQIPNHRWNLLFYSLISEYVLGSVFNTYIKTISFDFKHLYPAFCVGRSYVLLGVFILLAIRGNVLSQLLPQSHPALLLSRYDRKKNDTWEFLQTEYKKYSPSWKFYPILAFTNQSEPKMWPFDKENRQKQLLNMKTVFN